jgi:uncharacterized protein (TIGR01777 family)
MKILITGGSGFIGYHLSQALLERGYEVISIDITPARIIHPRFSFVVCDLLKDDISNLSLLNDLHGVVHLSGKNIVVRWTKETKQAIYDSRIVTTKKLVTFLSKQKHKSSVFVSASAVGYYGDTGEELVTEEHAPGIDFLAMTCVAWEKESREASEFGIRSVQIRTASVLGPGGFLAQVAKPFHWYLGSWFGHGSNWFPWIHYKDLVALYVYALEKETVSGAYNAVAPELVTQKILFKAYGKAIRQPIWARIPAFVVKLVFGSLSQLFLMSQKISSEKVQKAGFTFSNKTLQSAMADL